MFKQTLSPPELHKTGRKVILAAFLLLACGTSCSRKPDPALCGEYYARLAQLSAAAHPALVAAARTSQGKQAVIEHCMQLARSQTRCTIAAGTLQEAVECEQADRKTFFEKYF